MRLNNVWANEVLEKYPWVETIEIDEMLEYTRDGVNSASGAQVWSEKTIKTLGELKAHEIDALKILEGVEGKLVYKQITGFIIERGKVSIWLRIDKEYFTPVHKRPEYRVLRDYWKEKMNVTKEAE